MSAPDGWEFRLSPDRRQFAVWEPGNEPWFIPVSAMQGRFVSSAEMDALGWSQFTPADSELLNSVARHLEARAGAVGDVSDDPAIFVAKARVHSAGVWREAAQEVRRLAPGTSVSASKAPLTDAERTMLAYALDQAQEKIWSEDGFTDEDQAAVTSLRQRLL